MPISPVKAQSQFQVTKFRGPWTRVEPTDVPPSQAVLSLNCEYNMGQAKTRYGFAEFWNLGKAINSIINWVKIPDIVSALGNYLFLYNSTDGKIQYVPNLLAPTLNDILTVVAEGISGASYGQQFFLAAYTTGALGAAQCRIFGVYPSTGAAIDRAFLGPIDTVPTLGNAASGVVTAGLHRVGYIITTRNGFTGAISPVSGGEFDTASSITAPGGQHIDVQINPTAWPTEASTIQLVMTPVTNPSRYFLVPNTSMGVVGGAAFPITTTIDIADEDLIAGTDVSTNQDLLTMTSGGTGPFDPFKLIEYGSRMVYMTYDGNGYPVFYASEPQNGQQITEQYHKRGLPGWRQITSGFVLRGVMYVTGPNWTFSFEDTGGYPVTWPSPTLVDGGIGSQSIDGAVVSPSGDFAVVAHTSGAYVFDGVYQELPISYMIDPYWQRINWAVKQTIRITINPTKKQILVAIPLDAATTPSHLFMFDYSDGFDPQKSQFSLWNLADSGYPRGLCVFQNPTTLRLETLIGRSTAGKLLRQMNPTTDLLPYRDDASGVGGTTGSVYQTACFPPSGPIAVMHKHLAMGVEISGRGTMFPVSYGIKAEAVSGEPYLTVTWVRPIALAANPHVQYYRQFDLNSERCTTKFLISGIDNYFALCAIRHIYVEWAAMR